MTAGPGTLVHLIEALLRDPRRPRLVCHTTDGARTELSGATLANWIAKVAGLLRDEMGLRPGDAVAVTATSGWQLAPVLLGCWWAGLTVIASDPPVTAVAFVPPGGDAEADEVLVLSNHPLGVAPAGIAAHQRDLTSAALPHTDRLGAPSQPGDAWDAAVVDGRPVTAAALSATIAQVADDLRAATPPGARPVLLSTLPWTVPHGIASTLLAALAAGGSLVQCPAASAPDRLAGVARVEHVTATVGTHLPGLVCLPG